MLLWCLLAVVGAGLALGGLAWATADPPVRPRDVADRRVPIAVLGDSDSQGYGDVISFPPGTRWRGGDWRRVTSQWTEVLAALRPLHLDFGERRDWGCRRRAAELLSMFGIERRRPRKWDHRFNFAFSAASTRDLQESAFAQVPWLLAAMAQDPAGWQGGVVVMRIGAMELGGAEILDAMTHDPLDDATREVIDGAADRVVAAARAIRAAHPRTAIVLVGIFDNTNMPDLATRWRTAEAMVHCRRGLDRFDDRLRAFVAGDPRAAFFDDRQWFAGHWGERDATGMPLHRVVRIAGHDIVHGMGDDPHFSVLADRHAGLVFNVLWAQAMSRTLAGLGFDLPPISDEEVESFVRERLDGSD